MVKGISRRVVVVRPPDASVFEEAIFVVRECGGSPHDVLREACAVAETYLKRPRIRRYRRKRWTSLQLGLAALSGGGAVGAVWAATALFGLF